METQEKTFSPAENMKAIGGSERAAKHFQDAAYHHLEAAKFHKNHEMAKAIDSFDKAIEQSKMGFDLQYEITALNDKYKK